MTTAQFHRNYAAWLKYEELSKAGKKVSLDINTRTGELVARLLGLLQSQPQPAVHEGSPA